MHNETRKNNLIRLIDKAGTQASLSKTIDIDVGYISQMKNGTRSIGEKTARKIEKGLELEKGWLDQIQEGDDKNNDVLKLIPSPNKSKIDEITIRQFDTGGSMGNGGLVLRDQPGVIESFKVSKEWANKNIHNATSFSNLTIVTGFGPSMKPMFNPGDPLIVDTGVNSVEIDAAFFFRVGDEGFIKLLQRIPGEGIRVKSKNPDFDSWTITEDMDFEVFGRVLKAWVSEDY